MSKDLEDKVVDSSLPKRYRHLKCGEDMGRCMICGRVLEHRDRTVPEPCDECRTAGLNKMVVDGKEVEIEGGYGVKFIEGLRRDA